MGYSKEKLILSDVDGCLLDWEPHFHNYMRSQGHERAYGIDSYWQELLYPKLSQDEARKLVYNFNTSAWMIRVPALRDARSGVARLVEHGYQFHVVSAMGIDPYARMARMINLEQLFGFDAISELTVTDMHDPDSKRETLSQYRDTGLPWIEDKPSNAALGAELGLRTFLMDHSYNQEFNADNVERVSSWADICGLILNKSQSSSP